MRWTRVYDTKDIASQQEKNINNFAEKNGPEIHNDNEKKVKGKLLHSLKHKDNNELKASFYHIEIKGEKRKRIIINYNIISCTKYSNRNDIHSIDKYKKGKRRRSI